MSLPSGPGRPRDPMFGERVLQATRELLVEVGFEHTTIQAVVARSGVHASAIYRRWSSRVEMIEEAVFPGFTPLSVEPTGDLEADLRNFLRLYVRTFGSPALRAARPGLITQRGKNKHRKVSEVYQRVSARPQFERIVRAAPADRIDPDVDLDDVFDMLLGAVMVRTWAHPLVAREKPLERTVEMLLRLLSPATCSRA